jgi:GTPase
MYLREFGCKLTRLDTLRRVGLVLLCMQDSCELLTDTVACCNYILIFQQHTIHRYTPVVHALNIRQAAQIISMHKDTTSNTNTNDNNSSTSSNDTESGIKSGERAVCRFRFMHYAEFIQPGTTIVLREGRTRGFGRVTAVH